MDNYTVIRRGAETEDDGYRIVVLAPDGWADLQTGICPDCGGQWVWAEAGRVPGARECQQCGSVLLASPCADGTGVITRLRNY